MQSENSELQIFGKLSFEFGIWAICLIVWGWGGFRDWIGWDMSIVHLEAGILRWTFCAYSAHVFSVADGFKHSRSFDFFLQHLIRSLFLLLLSTVWDWQWVSRQFGHLQPRQMEL